MATINITLAPVAVAVDVAKAVTPVTVGVVSTPSPVTVTAVAGAALTAAIQAAPVPAVEVEISTARDAYQLALAEGFVGTRAEWLESLQGEDGPPGPTGVGLPWVTISEDDYAALVTKDPNTIYDVLIDP